MKKRVMALAAAMLIMCSACALAETDLSECSISSGNVTAPEFYDVTAPYSGTLMSFDLSAGDRVTSGQELFCMLENTVYAPEDGRVVKCFGASGDDAKAKSSVYGGVVAIEPAREYWITATTQESYQSNDNRVLHVGEKLYFKTSKSDKTEGEGTVIAVSAPAYTVEIEDGDFDLKDSFLLYRNSNYSAKENVGKGIVVRRDPVFVPAEGRIGKVVAKEGTTVSSGDPLFTIMSNDADPDCEPVIKAEKDGVVAQVSASSGQQVWKGQVLARIYSTEKLEITADVDEVDLNGLKVGDRLSYTLDTNPSQVETGEVTEISALGYEKQNAAYFTVHLEISPKDVMIGQSTSIYLPK